MCLLPNKLCNVYSCFKLVFLSWIYLEPYRERFDWFRAASCQGDGVFGPEEICSQRPRSTQLHVSHRDVQRNKQFVHCH